MDERGKLAIGLAGIGAVTLFLWSGVWERKADEPATVAISPICDEAFAQKSANAFAETINARLSDENLRNTGCQLFALFLDDPYSATTPFRENEAVGCEWNQTESTHPRNIAHAWAKRSKNDMAARCPDLDTMILKAQLESRGSAVLNSLPPGEQQQIRNDWESYR